MSNLQKNNITPENRGNRFQFDQGPNFQDEAGKGDGLDAKKIISLLFRYKWTILLFIIIGCTCAWFYADYVTPVYEANGTILIKTSAGAQEDQLAQLMSQTTGYGLNTTLANQLEIFKSRSFSRQIAEAIMNQDSALTISDYPVLWTYNEEKNEFSRAGKEKVASRILKNISFKKPEDEADVIQVSFGSTSPKEAAEIVNKSMELYVENSKKENRKAASSTAEFLKKEKEEAKEKLRKAEAKLQTYMDSSGIVEVDAQAAKMVANKEDTKQELQKVNLELKTTQETISKYEEQLEKIKPGLSQQFTEAIEPRIKSLQEDMAGYEKERRLIIARNPGVLDQKPLPSRLKFLDEQITKLKSDIKNLSSKLFNNQDEFIGINADSRAEAVVTIQNKLVDLRIQENQYKSRKKALEEFQKEVDAKFNALPAGMVELAKLQREVKLNEGLYLNLSNQYANMSVLKQSKFGYGQIIDLADVPKTPVSPNRKILILLGLMLGGFVSAVFIATREFMNKSVNSLNQLRHVYYPSLNLITIPSIKKISKKRLKSFKGSRRKIPNELIMLQDNLNLVSESIRRLMNNIIFQNGDAPPKTLAVTSPAKGDGKSTIVSNLGIAFAEAGYKTLLIDVDLRRPKLHKYLGLGSGDGLSDYFEEKISISELIKSPNINSLSVITTGSRANNPGAVTGSIKFKKLVEKLKKEFDIIIFDTPPFGIISDSTAVLKYSESTIVVARYQETNKGLLFRTIDQLDQIKANVTNIVLNDFDYRKETDNYYGSGYFEALYGGYYDYAK